MLLLGPAFGSLVPAGPPASGTWDIPGQETLFDATYYINGSVRVLSSGSLTFINSTIIFSAGYTISVYPYARLRIEKCSVLSQNPHGGRGTIGVSGNAELIDTGLDHVALEFGSGSVGLVQNCTLTGDGPALRASQASLELYGSTFIDVRWDNLILAGGNSYVVGCRFFRTAADAVDWPDRGYDMGYPWPSVNVQCNSFIRDTDGVYIQDYDFGGQRNTWAGLYFYAYDNSLLALVGNVFAGYDFGARLSLGTSGANVSRNTFSNCDRGIYAELVPNNEIVLSQNIIDGAVDGIRFMKGDFHISQNTISNCSSSGIMNDYYWSGVLEVADISGNRIRRCDWGIHLQETAADIVGNDIADCGFFGIQSWASGGTRGSLIAENTVARSGLEQWTPGGPSAGIMAETSPALETVARNNTLLDNPYTGMELYGSFSARSNNISGSDVGLRVSGAYKPPELSSNRIWGCAVGMELDAQSIVTGNDVSGVRVGLMMNLSPYCEGDGRVEDNFIQSSGAGACIDDPNGAGWKVPVEGNTIASAGDGVRVDAAFVPVRGNFFGGTSGFCVRAVGVVAELGPNTFGSMCRGRLIQQWYLKVMAQSSKDPYGAGSWTYTDAFEVRISNSTRAHAFSGFSGEHGTSMRTPLTGYIIDRGGNATPVEWYNIIVLKPGVGTAESVAVLANNTVVLQKLWPRSDLAVQGIEMPEGRPQPGQLVKVTVQIVSDSTYDTEARVFTNVKVSLYDGVNMPTEKAIPRLGPNESASVSFGWYAMGGRTTLTSAVDPDRYIAEAFEDNNQFSLQLTVNSPPVAVLEVSNFYPKAGQTVAFSSKQSTDDIGLGGSLFDFGDGTSSGWTPDQSVLHAYAQAGLYEARLMVVDGENQTSDWCMSQLILVSERPPDVLLTAGSVLVDTLVPVTFTATTDISGGGQEKYLWDFGDGAGVSGRNASRVEHPFARPGKFLVTVTVSGEDQLSRSATMAVTVRNRPPAADFSFSPLEPTVLAPVQFSSSSSDQDGFIEGWLWDFGDGNQSDVPSPAHYYSDDGNYTVMLAVRDDSGSWGVVAARGIRVRNLPPVARARSSAIEIPAGGTVRLDACLTADPDDPFSSLDFRWSANDSWASTGAEAARRFDRPGKYQISLTVIDDDGAISEDTLTITVRERGPSPAVEYRPLTLGMLAAAGLFGALAAVLWRNGKKKR